MSWVPRSLIPRIAASVTVVAVCSGPAAHHAHQPRTASVVGRAALIPR